MEEYLASLNHTGDFSSHSHSLLHFFSTAFHVLSVFLWIEGISSLLQELENVCSINCILPFYGYLIGHPSNAFLAISTFPLISICSREMQLWNACSFMRLSLLEIVLM